MPRSTISFNFSAFSLSQHSNRSQLSEAFVVEIEVISDRRCRSIGDRSKSRAGGGCLEAKAVGRQASRGGSKLRGSGGGISSTMVSRGPVTGRIDGKKLCGCRYVAFSVPLVAELCDLFERGHVLLVGRPRHAEPEDNITCHECKNALATVVPGNERQKEKMFTVPSAARQEQWKEIYRHFSGDHMFVRSIVSYSRYDNLHLADPRHGRSFLGAYSGAHYLSNTGPGWLDANCRLFSSRLAAGYSDTTAGLGGLQTHARILQH